MRVGLIGCVDSSLMALKTLHSIEGVEVVAVVTRNMSLVNSDFQDLSPLCIEYGIPYHYEDPQNKSLTFDFLSKFDMDVIYCIGWSYLLKQDILNLPSFGVVGFHPAKLPQNRGRHPIIWALVLGLDETASTFFKMDAGADSGPILSQRVIEIESSDDSLSLYKKILGVAEVQLRDLSKQFMSGVINPLEQDCRLANYWRKRSRSDGLIDFRMNVDSIHNLVRALAPPYPCAEFKINNNLYRVPKSAPLYGVCPKNIEPGFVIKRSDRSLIVKVSGEDAIHLMELDFDTSDVEDYL